MDQEGLVEYIVGRLSSSVSINDITYEVCEKSGMQWQDAKAWIEDIRLEQANSVTRRQSPILITIALSLFIGGLVVVGYTVYTFIDLYDVAVGTQATELGVTFFLLYTFQYAPLLIPLFLTGCSMILGSLLGMQNVWTALFDW